MPTSSKKVRHILAIETSCDETAAAVLAFSETYTLKRENYSLLSSVVSSQVKLHAKFGGVVPMLAAREQQKNIEPVITQALQDAKLTLGDIQYFAVTSGPGLIPSLHVGVNYARAISFAMGKPLIGINHLEGHVYSNWLTPIAEISNFKIPNSKKLRSDIPKPKTYNLKPETFPILNLIVSGGHTELVLMRTHCAYELIGETLDDAAGEAFDKAARMLMLPYPGGPALSKEAAKGNPAAFNFPRPMLMSKNYDFSFSGLKTSVLYTLQDLAKAKRVEQQGEFYKAPDALRADICASFQQAVVDVLAAKTIRSAKETGAKSVFVAGGVSANKLLRETLAARVAKDLPGASYRCPPMEFTGDNAAMIAMAAYWRITGDKRLITHDKQRGVTADANLRIA